MTLTTAETIKEITDKHLTKGNGLLLGQCVSAVGWIGGTVPDVQGIVEIPMTDVAGPSFAVGAALMGRRPIFVVRYQGFMYYNCSTLINYAARSKEVWGVPCPVFIRSLGMEGNGVGHTASSCVHTMFMHTPGMPVACPVTPGEYRAVWEHYIQHDDPIYVSEHRKTYPIKDEMPDKISHNSKITLMAISGARLNALEASKKLTEQGIEHDLCHIMWLKPFAPSEELLKSLSRTKLGLIVDSDFELAGAAQALAYDLMHKTDSKVFALGLEDRVCGVAKHTENITPSPEKIMERIGQILKGK